MARWDFTKEQLEKIQHNPNVISATPKRIVYTTEFKKKFIEEYRNGLGPREIFIKAGFDVEAIGYKRIERASDRWREAYNKGMLGENKEFLPVHRDKTKKSADMRDRIKEQDAEIARLETELAEIRKELSTLKNQGKQNGMYGTPAVHINAFFVLLMKLKRRKERRKLKCVRNYLQLSCQ